MAAMLCLSDSQPSTNSFELACPIDYVESSGSLRRGHSSYAFKIHNCIPRLYPSSQAANPLRLMKLKRISIEVYQSIPDFRVKRALVVYGEY